MSRLALLAITVVSIAFLTAVTAQPRQAKGPELAPSPQVGWTMYGGTPARNMVNLHDKLPYMDDAKAAEKWETEWLLWKADLGSRSYAQPVVAGGKVFVGTNNEHPRNIRDTFKNKEGEIEPIDKSILMSFDAATGKFLWQAVHDKLPSGQVNDWPKEGLCSIPTVVGDRVYYVSNQCRVVCLDANGFADGNQGFQGEKYRDATDADIIWEYDKMKELKVFPHNMSTGCPLILGDLLFVQTSNGVDDGHINVPSPDAPSFICLNRQTGKLVWSDNSPGKEIMHGQWASPAYASVPVPQVIFPGGDGWLRAFDPPTGKLLWKFDCNPKDAVWQLGGTGTKSDFIAAPVVYDGRVYIGTGQDPEHYTGISYFWCIDLAKAIERGAASKLRDVSPELVEKVEKQPDGTRKVFTKANPTSALSWKYGGEENRKWAERDFKFGRTLSTACVVDDIVYVPELAGYLHCLDAKTGKHYWAFDARTSIWGSAYYVDNKILLTDEEGNLLIFRHQKQDKVYDELAASENIQNMKLARAERKVVRAQVQKKYLIAKIELDAPIRGTPSVANGVLYVATEKTLYAFGKTQQGR
jgi:outer membrane protein assembly factor BamB